MGYSVKTTPVIADQAFIWDSENSDIRRTPLSAINTLLAENDSEDNLLEPVTQYYAPATTGFALSLDNSDQDIHVILTPTETLATGILSLPISSSLRDKQTVTLNTTQEISSFGIDGNGADAVHGAPTVLTINSFFKLKYDLTMNSWYRIG